MPAFTPTGITGVLTHPHPRPALIALYNHTLNVLATLPSHSIYRQSTENLTKARLEAVRSVTPHGLAEFQAKAGTAESDIRNVAVYMRQALNHHLANTEHQGNKNYVAEELKHWGNIPIPANVDTKFEAETGIELEPQLQAEQVEELENKIGEGLIEEVIEEGWGELKCVEVMKEDAVWEPLAVVPEEGQWVQFERIPAAGAGPV